MRFGRRNELMGRAHKSVNLDEGLIVALRRRQEHHESFSDVVNRLLRLAVHLLEDREEKVYKAPRVP